MSKAPLLLIAVVFVTTASTAQAADWITSRSSYTHDPKTGQRVDQYAQPAPAVYYEHPNFRTSGMRHLRSSLQVGGVADNRHVVESWGEEVRPYGEWRFPFRPYSVPYPAWGQPPGFVGPGFGFGGGAGGGVQGYLDPYGASPGAERSFDNRRPRRGHYSPPHAGYAPPHAGYAAPGGDGAAPHAKDHHHGAPIPQLFPRNPTRPATPDRWRPYHDGGYPTLPRDFYQPAY